MTNSQYLPALMILMAMGSSVFYFFEGDWRMGVYWMAAAVLTTVVTF